MSQIKVGIAQVDYTPPVGLPLLGNFRDDYGSRGIHDPLYARAVVFEDGAGQKVAMLALDICMFSRDNVAFLRKTISSQCDIKAENIMAIATHTHSGPASLGFGNMPKAKDSEIEEFLGKAATAVVLANQNINKAKLAVGHSEEDRVSFNRRLKCKDGKVHMNWEGLDPEFVIEPLSSKDTELITLSIEQDGKAAAAIVNFGLHPAVLAGDNWLYSADFPGYLAEAMSKVFGDEFMTLFCNGCCGNINNIDYSDKLQGRGYMMTQRIGYMLGVAAQVAMAGQETVKGDELSVSREMVSLSRYKINQEKQKWANEVLEKAKTAPSKGTVDGLPDEFYAKKWLEMHEKENVDDKAEVMVIRVGGVGIVSLPGEMFYEIGTDIKKRSAAKHTIVIELTNDAIGYIPDKKAYGQGGYEDTPGSTVYESGAGERLADSAVKQLEKLFG